MLSELWRARLTGALVATVVAAPLGVPGIVLAAGSTGGGATAGAGANDPCPGHNYCPTSPGPDNQGNGNAPIDGSVGNADAKNPPGQFPDGSDSNAGYECEPQHTGVQNGNPAHTACTVIPVQGNGAAGLALAALSVPVFGGVLYVMSRRRRETDAGALA